MALERLDKVLATGALSRKEVKTLARKGRVLVNGQPAVSSDIKIDPETADICVDGEPFSYKRYVYIMLNKPQGYICASRDQKEKCVVELIENQDCFCLGRLDKNTTGLVILTNDKSLKKLLLPENHVKKSYFVTTRKILLPEIVEQFHQGVIIDQDVRCLPADLEIVDDHHGIVTIEEGKYHQIKKMFLSVNNQVVLLHRHSFGPIILDSGLKPGKWRYLTISEREKLLNVCKKEL